MEQNTDNRTLVELLLAAKEGDRAAIERLRELDEDEDLLNLSARIAEVLEEADEEDEEGQTTSTAELLAMARKYLRNVAGWVAWERSGQLTILGRRLGRLQDEEAIQEAWAIARACDGKGPITYLWNADRLLAAAVRQLSEAQSIARDHIVAAEAETGVLPFDPWHDEARALTHALAAAHGGVADDSEANVTVTEDGLIEFTLWLTLLAQAEEATS